MTRLTSSLVASPVASLVASLLADLAASRGDLSPRSEAVRRTALW